MLVHRPSDYLMHVCVGYSQVIFVNNYGDWIL